MKIEDRLRKELSDTAEHLALDVDTYEQVLDLGRRRRRSHQLLAAAGTVTVAAIVVGVFALSPQGAPEPIVATSTTSPATTTTLEPAGTPAMEGVIVATSSQGILISGFDGTQVQLSSDKYYEAIAWVVSDGEGGLVFQHEVTPLPWEQGTILHLPAGGSAPVELVAPEPGTYIRPLDTDAGLILYRVDSGGTSEIRAIDPGTGEIETLIPTTPFLIGASADDGVMISAYGGDCPRLEVSRLDGSPVDDTVWNPGECQIGFINDLSLSGGYLYSIEDGEGRNLVRRHLATGTETVTPIADAWSVASLSDGTVAIGGSEIIVGSFEGESFVENSRSASGSTFTLAAVAGFGAEATLGSGSGELPCTPIQVPPISPQGLPQPVEDKRLQIFTMAAECDLAGLGGLALEDGTAFTFGGEPDPMRSWIRSARNGFDVMSWIVRLLNTTPAADDVGTYAWPAVHATNTDEDWQELSGLLTAAEYEQYSQSRDSGWLGLRIGIAEDGTWRYVVAGD